MTQRFATWDDVQKHLATTYDDCAGQGDTLVVPPRGGGRAVRARRSDATGADHVELTVDLGDASQISPTNALAHNIVQPIGMYCVAEGVLTARQVLPVDGLRPADLDAAVRALADKTREDRDTSDAAPDDDPDEWMWSDLVSHLKQNHRNVQIFTEELLLFERGGDPEDLRFAVMRVTDRSGAWVAFNAKLFKRPRLVARAALLANLSLPIGALSFFLEDDVILRQTLPLAGMTAQLLEPTLAALSTLTTELRAVESNPETDSAFGYIVR